MHFICNFDGTSTTFSNWHCAIFCGRKVPDYGLECWVLHKLRCCEWGPRRDRSTAATLLDYEEAVFSYIFVKSFAQTEFCSRISSSSTAGFFFQ